VNYKKSTEEDNEPGIKLDEVRAAIAKMKKNLSPGIDNVTAEEDVWMVVDIWQLLQQVWSKEEFSANWKKAVIVPIYKKKDRMNCNNYRGISLLRHFSKLFTSILLQRLKSRTDEILAEEQAGFRAGRSTIDEIFTLRQLAEKYVEFSKELYVCYIDFRKAFNSVWREGLWEVMWHMGYPEKIVRILEKIYEDYEGTCSAVRAAGGLSEWFETVVGVLQAVCCWGAAGCVLLWCCRLCLVATTI